MTSNILFIIRRRWAILVLLPLVVVGAVVFLTPTAEVQPTRYTSRVHVGADPTAVNSVQLQQAALEVKREAVVLAAAARLEMKPENAQDFARALRTRVQPESLTIVMASTYADADYAQRYTQAFADAFVDAMTMGQAEQRNAEVENLREARNVAQMELASFVEQNRLVLAGENPDPTVVAQRNVLSERLTSTEARLREAEERPNTLPYEVKGIDPIVTVAPDKLQLPASRSVRAVLALIIGVIGAVGLAALTEKLNPRVDSPSDASDIVGASVLAQIPVVRGKQKTLIERASLADFSGPFAESFRATRSHMDFLASVEQLERPPCIMVVSSAPGEGKTTTSAFLGLSYAEIGREVVVIGGDFRRPAIHNLFDVPRTPGLSSRVLGGDGSRDEALPDIVRRDPQTGVRVIPSGPGTDRVAGLLGDLALVTEAGLRSGCTVIIDTAPVMVANDALDYLPLVDWVVVVVRLGKTTERSLRQTISTLELNQARIAGCVIVGSLEASDAKRYYYSYYSVEEERRKTPPKAPAGSDGFPDVDVAAEA